MYHDTIADNRQRYSSTLHNSTVVTHTAIALPIIRYYNVTFYCTYSIMIAVTY